MNLEQGRGRKCLLYTIMKGSLEICQKHVLWCADILKNSKRTYVPPLFPNRWFVMIWNLDVRSRMYESTMREGTVKFLVCLWCCLLFYLFIPGKIRVFKKKKVMTEFHIYIFCKTKLNAFLANESWSFILK